MNEPLKQFSEQLAAELKAKLASSETAEFVKQTKASGDDRSFEVVMSTSDEDRQGDELDQSKWDLKYFNMNPVVLWAHNYSSFPIGAIEDIKAEGNETIATGKFAPAGLNPESDLACSLYQEKILRAVSPGYIQNDDGTRELLEVSFCPVPAGRYALSLRQVGRLGVSTQDLVTKGFFYEEKKNKSPQVGDACQLDDGTPGVLAEDDKNPGDLVCVPERNKSQETSMKTELEKTFKAEHERHGEAVGKAIDEFGEKCLKGEKAEGHLDKAIEEYTKAMDGEQEGHLEKCMKAIDDNYELQDQTPKKSIDEFKSEVTDEHLKHVKACDKAIEEFKAEPGYSDDEKKKAIEAFTKSMGGELSRHEEAHAKLLKDEMGEGDKDEKALAEEIVKSGRAISAKNKGKIESVIKALEDHHQALTSEHEKSTNTVIAALKELIAPQGDEGEEPSKEPEDDESKGEEAPNSRSSTSGAGAKDMTELEAYLFVQRLVRQVKTASEGALRQINEKVKKHRTERS